jgi:CMP-N,N'-diacetyllegionaminic acid synthase
MKIVALIPARGGSKGIPHKNIKDFCGKPLISHSIELSKNSKYINEIIVSTDSLEIADIALKYGANVPFIRPPEISQDNSPDIDFIKHYLSWLNETNKDIPDIIVHLRPTYPIRNLDFLNNCIEQMIENYDTYDSLRTITENKSKSPFKMYTIDKNILKPVVPPSEFPFIKELYNQCRQVLPITYTHNGCIDIIKTSIINNNMLSGNKILPVVMEDTEVNDIDTPDDWENAENRYNRM